VRAVVISPVTAKTAGQPCPGRDPACSEHQAKENVLLQRQRKRAAAISAPATIVVAALGVTAAASTASAKAYPPPSIHLLCTAAANNGTLEGSVCALPPGVTTAPNSYSATIAAAKAGAAGASISFALTAGSLPPGLALAPSSGSGTVISGNPAKAGVSTFTIKATDGGLTSTLSYEITITVQGPPDQLLCSPAGNGGFLESGSASCPTQVQGSGRLLISRSDTRGLGGTADQQDGRGDEEERCGEKPGTLG
jgi:hypothetical protein